MWRIFCFNYFYKRYLLAFEDTPCHRSGYSLCRSWCFSNLPCSILFRSISAFSIHVAYTIDFTCPHKWKSNGFKSGERAGHATGPPRPIHLFAKCWFKNCLATRLKRGGAPSCTNRIPSLISTETSSNISCKLVLKKSTYFVPVSFPSRKKGPIKNLSIISAHTFKLVLNAITRGFSSSQL